MISRKPNAELFLFLWCAIAGALFIEAPGGIYSKALEAFVNAQINLKLQGECCDLPVVWSHSHNNSRSSCTFAFLGIHGQIQCHGGWKGRLCDEGSSLYNRVTRFCLGSLHFHCWQCVIMVISLRYSTFPI